MSNAHIQQTNSHIRVASGPLLLQAVSGLDKKGALSQAPENAIDAILALREQFSGGGTAKIWIVYEVVKGKGRIRVIDTGLGMVPHMELGHADIVKDYLAGEGTILQQDLNRLIPPHSYSRHSVERMFTKALLLPDGQIGVQGLGAAAGWVIGKRVSYTIRPFPKLAQSAGLPLGKDGMAETFCVSLPTVEDLESNQMSYTIGPSTRQLCDPWGKPLPHGVMVVIDDIDPSTIKGSSVISPKRVLSYLNDRFGRFAQQDIELLIIDRLGKTERTFKVQRPAYRGIPLYSETTVKRYYVKIDGELYPYDVELYYAPSGTSVPPAWLVREGAGLCVLGEFTGFDRLPGAGVITGDITTPHKAPLSHFGLRTADKLPDPDTPGVRAWIEHVKKYVYPMIEQAMKDAVASQDEKARILMQRISDRVTDLLGTGGMSEFLPHTTGAIVDGSGDQVPIKGLGSKRHRSNDVSLGKQTSTCAVVYDEFTRGVEGVKVQLIVKRKLYREELTNANGYVSFGRLPQMDTDGERVLYTMRVIPPEGMTVKGNSTSARSFQLTDRQPGVEKVFLLNIGADAPEKASVRGGDAKRSVSIEFAELCNSFQVYEVHVAAGLVVINMGYQVSRRTYPIREAFSNALDGNPASLDLLVATVGIDAIADLLFGLGFPPEDISAKVALIRMKLLIDSGVLR